MFTITEIGGPRKTFRWSASANAGNGSRACPVKPWELPEAQNYNKTTYPGSLEPSFQVLGNDIKPFNLSGKWQDSYNYPGYAVETMRDFVDLCRRGNMCKFEIGSISVIGLITNWAPKYLREAVIEYSFTVDPVRESRQPLRVFEPEAALSFSDVVTQVTDQAKELLAIPTDEWRRPSYPGSGNSRGDDTDTALSGVSQAVSDLNDTVEGSEGVETRQPSQAIALAAGQLRLTAGKSQAVVESLLSVRSDLDTAYADVQNVIAFESRTREIRKQARLLFHGCTLGAEHIEMRSSSTETRIYRPFKGESIYRIAVLFYGTPHAWRTIAAANNLATLEFTGDEILTIPDAGAA